MIALAFILVAGGWLLLYSGITNRDPREELAAALRGSHAPERANGGGSVSDPGASPTSVSDSGDHAGDPVEVGKRLQKMGYKVSEHPSFGGVLPVHAPNSYHYRGLALDVNADGMAGGEAAALDRIEPMLAGTNPVELFWREAGHYDHLHIAWSRRQ